jgi:hypothetical protein
MADIAVSISGTAYRALQLDNPDIVGDNFDNLTVTAFPRRNGSISYRVTGSDDDMARLYIMAEAYCKHRESHKELRVRGTYEAYRAIRYIQTRLLTDFYRRGLLNDEASADAIETKPEGDTKKAKTKPFYAMKIHYV